MEHTAVESRQKRGDLLVHSKQFKTHSTLRSIGGVTWSGVE